MIDAIKFLSGAFWMLLILTMGRPFLRFVGGNGRSLDAVWACVCFGSFNRLSFTLVAIYIPASDVAKAICYTLGMVTSVWMILAYIYTQRKNGGS